MYQNFVYNIMMLHVYSRKQIRSYACNSDPLGVMHTRIGCMLLPKLKKNGTIHKETPTGIRVR
jgi:hypothetical protein